VLYFDGTADSTDRAGELHEKGISDGLHLATSVSGESRAENPSMLLEQTHRLFLGEQSVANNVGEHYHSDSSLTDGPFHVRFASICRMFASISE
jgi:hypothetical protein